MVRGKGIFFKVVKQKCHVMRLKYLTQISKYVFCLQMKYFYQHSKLDYLFIFQIYIIKSIL